MTRLFGESGRACASDIAASLGADVRDTGSFMNEFRYAIGANYMGMRLSIEVAAHGHKIRVSVENFRSHSGLAFVCGQRYPGFDQEVVVPLSEVKLRVYTMGPVDGEGVRNVGTFFDDASNSSDVRAIELGGDEWLGFFADAISARFDYAGASGLLGRLSILARLFVRNRRPGNVRTLVATGYRIALAPDEDPAGAAHLLAPQITEGLPPCRNCRAPLHWVASIDLGDPVLGVRRGSGRLFPVLTCLGCDANATPIVYTRAQPIRLLSEECGTAFPLRPERFSTIAIHLVPLAEHDVDLSTHRLGGKPVWLQHPFVPVCTGCGKDMSYVLQLATIPELDIQFGDDGVLYAFYCHACDNCATFCQWC